MLKRARRAAELKAAAKKAVGKVSRKVPASKPAAKTLQAKIAIPKSSKPTAKSSNDKRSVMPSKTAKTPVKPTVAKAAPAKTPSAKVAAPKTNPSKVAASKVAEPKVAVKPAPKAAEVKPVVAKPEVAVAAKVPVATAKPVATVKPVATAKPVVAAKPAPPPVAQEPKKALTQRQGFKTNEFVVYPAHGVGQILAIEEQEIAGAKLELFVINFMKDKMTLRVPTAKVANVGMRKLSDPALVKRALETLKGRARIKRTMWSRRAQEYEAKINSGDIVAIAEVVRDLYRSDSQPEQSYSERQLYEAALDRLSREIAVVQHVTETEAVKEIEGQLAKSPRRGAKTEGSADGEADTDADADDDTAVADEAA